MIVMAIEAKNASINKGIMPRAVVNAAMDTGRSRLAALSDSGAERLHGLVAVLQQAMQWRERLSLRDWIESTWLALHGPACAEQPDQLAEAEEFLDLLEERDKLGEAYDEAILADQVASLYASAVAGTCKLQLMTLHKAKGLEFD